MARAHFVRQPGRAVSIRDDELPELSRILKLAIRENRRCASWSPEDSCGLAYVLRRDRARHLVDTDASIRE